QPGGRLSRAVEQGSALRAGRPEQSRQHPDPMAAGNRADGEEPGDQYPAPDSRAGPLSPTISVTSVERSSRYAWIVVALLLPVALLNYLDRQMLATMKASMVSDIPTIANKADWGLILGSFKWSYA